VVDALSGAGRLEEAENLIGIMALLAGCRWNSDIGEQSMLQRILSNWIHIMPQSVSFLVDDKSHELTNNIQAELKIVFSEMREHGYIPNTKFVMPSINDEEKERHLCPQ
jgi:hypothetical protein